MTARSPLSSWSSSLLRRLRGTSLALALWATAALAAAVLVVVLLHDPSGGPRDDVDVYIRHVNATATAAQKDSRTIERAYRSFALTPAKGTKQATRLRAASADLTRLRTKIERVPAPPPAARLKSRLVAFFRQQEAVAWELLGVSTYVPRLTAAEQGLGPASNRMRTALAGSASTTAAQAAALDAYAAALDRAVAAVSAIRPPELFRETHGEQVARLRRASQLVRRLSGALSANDRATVQSTIRRLGAPSAPSNAAARAAIQAYNRRVVRIRALAGAVERERVRLDKQLR